MLFSKGNKPNSKLGNAQNPLVAVDIGTSKIRLIAGEVNSEGEVSVLYYDEEPSSGVVNGAVSDLSKLSSCLAELVGRYDENTEYTFSHCVIGISGRHIQSQNEKGNATVPSHKVTEADRDNALQHASSIKFSEYGHLIHVVPQSYEIESSKDIVNPIGLSAMRLSVGVHLIACNEDQENNFKSAFERLTSNIKVDQVIYNGLAAADAVLSKAEKEIGVCLVDIGGGSINVAVYDQGKLILTFGFDFGGGAITRSLATRYGIPLVTAEHLKVSHAAAHPNLLDDEERGTVLSVPVLDGNEQERIYISRLDLATVVCQRLMDTLHMVRDRIDAYNRDHNVAIPLGGGIVLTGGVALTQGVAHLAAKYLNIGEKTSKQKARIGIPRGVSAPTEKDLDVLSSPEWATAIGLLRSAYANAQDNDRQRLNREHNGNRGGLSKAYSSLRDWLSREF